MLVFREIKKNEIKIVKGLIDLNTIETIDDVIIYAAIDNSAVIGVSVVQIIDNKSYLETLFIRPEDRGQNMGLPLLRSILNKLESLGIVNIYYPGEDSYLMRNDFVVDGNELSLDIPLYFKSIIKECGKCNEV